MFLSLAGHLPLVGYTCAIHATTKHLLQTKPPDLMLPLCLALQRGGLQERAHMPSRHPELPPAVLASTLPRPLPP